MIVWLFTLLVKNHTSVEHGPLITIASPRGFNPLSEAIVMRGRNKHFSSEIKYF